jgi:hypothetical protein
MKIANILLLSASIAALAACGKTQPDTANPGDGAAPTTEEPAVEEPAAEEPAAEEPAEEAAAEEPAAE